MALAVVAVVFARRGRRRVAAAARAAREKVVAAAAEQVERRRDLESAARRRWVPSAQAAALGGRRSGARAGGAPPPFPPREIAMARARCTSSGMKFETLACRRPRLRCATYESAMSTSPAYDAVYAPAARDSIADHGTRVRRAGRRLDALRGGPPRAAVVAPAPRARGRGVGTSRDKRRVVATVRERPNNSAGGARDGRRKTDERPTRHLPLMTITPTLVACAM